MKRTVFPLLTTCCLSAATIFGCADVEVEQADGSLPLLDSMTDVETIEAGKELAEHGIESYRLEMVQGATSVVLEGAGGKVLGELLVYDPHRVLHMELSWDGHEDAFELDVQDPEAPLTVVTKDGAATIKMGRDGTPEADLASLAIHAKVKPRLDIAAKIFRDLNIAQRQVDVVARSESFTLLSGDTKSEQGAVATPQNLDGAPCGWCDGKKNCNFLGWSRWYHGNVNGNYCVSYVSNCWNC